MSYFIEFGLDRGAGLYAEFIVASKRNGLLLPGDGIDHQFYIQRDGCDYGRSYSAGQLLASNSNGLISAPAPGVIAMDIPSDVLCGFANNLDTSWYDFGARSVDVLRCKMIAVPSPDFNADFVADYSITPATPCSPFAKTLFTGTLSFGDRVMSNARVRLGTYPLYPSFTAGVPIGTGNLAGVTSPRIQLAVYPLASTPVGCSQRQWRAALAASGYLNIVGNAIPPDENDPVTMQWESGLLVITGDALWGASQAALAAALGAFANAQMIALLAAAQILPF